MGTGADAVTDPASLRVHGLDGLRVVDASGDAVYHQREHLRSRSRMTAEKAADRILGNTPLPPPEPVLSTVTSPSSP